MLLIIWFQRLADVVNKWRASIDLSPIPTTEGPSLHEGLKIPFTYCWSPALVPKPQDWPAYIGMYKSAAFSTRILIASQMSVGSSSGTLRNTTRLLNCKNSCC